MTDSTLADADSALATALVRTIVGREGCDPQSFQATLASNSTVVVRGPYCAAFYGFDGWLDKFRRHLHAGYFDPVQRRMLGVEEVSGSQAP